jgi:DNA-binding transcriptional regulator YiaG
MTKLPLPPNPNVKQIREQLGLTQLQLARKLHTTVTTVSRWESGQSKPQYIFRFGMERLLKK